LAESGLAWTALRHGYYAASALDMNAAGLDAGVLAVPEDGKVAWTTHDDLAAADAVLLAGQAAGQGDIDGPTPPLTANATLDLADLALLASEICNRSVTRTVVDDRQMTVVWRARGVPENVIDITLGYFL